MNVDVHSHTYTISTHVMNCPFNLVGLWIKGLKTSNIKQTKRHTEIDEKLDIQKSLKVLFAYIYNIKMQAEHEFINITRQLRVEYEKHNQPL